MRVPAAETDWDRIRMLLGRAGEEGMLVADIAGMLGLSEEQVWGRLNEAKKRGATVSDGRKPQRWWHAESRPGVAALLPEAGVEASL
jgi:hypothetical protein